MLGLEINTAKRPVCELHRNKRCRGVSTKPYPEDSNWKICKVWVLEDNKKHLRTLVTSDFDLVVGMMVPYVPSRDLLPFQTQISPPFSEEEFSGYLCTPRDLGIKGYVRDSVLCMHSAPFGADVFDILGGGDKVLDVELTPNRPDCLSIRGLAREVSMLTKSPILRTLQRKALDTCYPSTKAKHRKCGRGILPVLLWGA